MIFRRSSRVKNLLKTICSKYGRMRGGSISVRHIRCGSKKNYRILDFRNAFYNIIGILIEIHYDPNRSAYIGLVNFVKIGLLSYVLLPDGLREGGKIFFYDGVSFIGDFIKVGFSCALKYMPLGVFLHNVEFKPGNGGGLARAAGTCVKVLRKSSLKKKKKN